ncbi:hypothetical protein NBRGN_112_00050 [Nocardia brasiliensis NBRC 14402]|uniref:hypothetical protein n=1 Tax=Nocardia brasiliensis TaxID=37326 RepID=UPI00045D4861|nr:hypothetical protein [Nocardia brasiliensis]GAJ86790.1 hypothetical protein NBRGN_112_00050 [Nocardia brasiliensis NBRC 14402]SUB11547.1 Uncharacterised protein [Nocardia brasiliensis]
MKSTLKSVGSAFVIAAALCGVGAVNSAAAVAYPEVTGLSRQDCEDLAARESARLAPEPNQTYATYWKVICVRDGADAKGNPLYKTTLSGGNV